MKKTLALVLGLLACKYGYAQTAADIRAKYGKSVDVYSVSEHIWMTPEFGIDGEICRARLYPKRISPKTAYLSKELPFQELIEVLNRLLPPGQRGSVKEGFGDTELGGGVGWTTYSYENVSIVFIFAARIGPKIPARVESPTFRVEDFPVRQNQKILPSYKDIPYSGDGIEIATIHWTKRKCGN